MITLTRAIGQFRILFFAASHTHNIPVITPHHSRGLVWVKKVVKLCLTASINDTMR